MGTLKASSRYTHEEHIFKLLQNNYNRYSLFKCIISFEFKIYFLDYLVVWSTNYLCNIFSSFFNKLRHFYRYLKK